MGADHACSSGSARTTRWSGRSGSPGPAERRQEALDAQLAFFRAHPEDTDREWLQDAIDYLAAAARDARPWSTPIRRCTCVVAVR